jgi:RNA polymerase sigma-70 factor (ECF subfamily)
MPTTARTDTCDFDAFYTRSARRVFGQVALLTGDVTEAEDVTQEAFERAWSRWAAVRACASPEAWVSTVARRLAISRWRRLRNATVAWGRVDRPPEPAEMAAEHMLLMSALRRLPEKQRVAVVLHHLADLSVEAVAEETASSISAVKQRLVRGRAALAELLLDGSAPDAREELHS